MTNTMPETRTHRRSALLRALAVAAFVSGLPVAGLAADKIGNCEVTGQKGSVTLKPRTPGELTVGTTMPAPGWFNGDTPDDVKDGYEYCMAANIAYRAGIDKIKVINIAYAQLLIGELDTFDIAFDRASITEERKKRVIFSTPYFTSSMGVVMKAGNKTDSTKIKEQRIGVQQGATSAAYVTNVLKPTTPVRVYPTVANLFAAVAAEQIDAMLINTPVALAAAKQMNNTIEVVGQYDSGEVYGAIYPKASPNVAAFDKAIETLKTDGTLDRLAKTYLASMWGTDPSKLPFFKP